MQKKLFSCLFIFISFTLRAQPPIPIEGWQTHLNYAKARQVAIAEDKIYTATENSIFYFDKEDNSLRKLSTIDGLSEIAIGAIGYNNLHNTLILGYRNGNLDLLRENTITNLTAIKEAAINSEKTINHVSTTQDEAYLSTEFGVVVIDLPNQEVKETWFPGEDGQLVKVDQSVLSVDSIYLLTQQNLLSGSLDAGVNLQDFRNWQRLPLPTGEKIAIALWQDQVILATSDQLWQKVNGQWQEITIDFVNPIRNLSVANGDLVVVTSKQIILLSPSLNIEILEAPVKDPRQAMYKNNNWWLADGEQGLLNNFESQWQSFFPSGPADNNSNKLFAAYGRVFALPPAKDNSNQPLNQSAQFSLYENNQWTTFTEEELPEVEDLNVVLFDALNDITWLGSYGDGLLRWDGESFEIVDNQIPGSPLAIFNDDEMLVSSLALGNQGDIWVSIFNASPPLHQVRPDGSGENYIVPGTRSNFVQKIVRYGNGDIWMSIAPDNGGGIVVYNPESQQSRLLTTTVGGGGLPHNQVNNILIDKDGFIWVGTDEGVAYFPNPFLALANQPIDAITPIFNQRRLLSSEAITALAIDGGNRKWIGTQNGLWLFGETGEELFYNFNTSNSPLLSNEILDIAVMDETGEIFIATAEGIISFRSTATKPESEYKQVKIFPNPVRSNYQGVVGIEGLVNNSVVKITTIGGQLIKEIRSYGGMATWDVTDFNNRRIGTGVYLVLMATESGDQDMVGKIAVVE